MQNSRCKMGESLYFLDRNLGLFNQYQLNRSGYDEYFKRRGEIHDDLEKIVHFFDEIPQAEFLKLHQSAQDILRQRGVTFNVYSDISGVEKIFPFDLFPRIIQTKEWDKIEKGLIQRIQALNAFLLDIYGKQRILKDRIIPPETIFSSTGFNRSLVGITPPGKVYIHVGGIDLIRVGPQEFKILEDNLQIPSGVSYVIENRQVMKQLFPTLFNQIPIKGVEDYPFHLQQALHSLTEEENPQMVLLTPGPYNAAYFEHTYLARRMSCPLVQNDDLVVLDDKVYMKSLHGLKRVHIIYRRTDDDYIDPDFFNPDSLLGVPGLVKAYLAGNVILSNALGNGVADDKGVYPFVPSIIRYYLNEEPILPQVTTYSCSLPEDCRFVLENLSSLVIKVVDQSGGYGVIIGPQASKEQLQQLYNQIKANPRSFIAQPVEEFSCCPTFDEGTICGRRIDYRPYIISGKTTWVLPGGLSRVALVKGSYVVNSSQGGGSKDTWVLS